MSTVVSCVCGLHWMLIRICVTVFCFYCVTYTYIEKKQRSSIKSNVRWTLTTLTRHRPIFSFALWHDWYKRCEGFFSLNKQISQIYFEIFWLLCRKKPVEAAAAAAEVAMNVTVLYLTVICQIENDFVLTRTQHQQHRQQQQRRRHQKWQ